MSFKYIGREHSGNCDFVICGFKAKGDDFFNIHLHTLQTFSCDYSWDPKITVNNLSDLVTHLKEKHSKHFKNTNIMDTKVDRLGSDEKRQFCLINVCSVTKIYIYPVYMIILS